MLSSTAIDATDLLGPKRLLTKHLSPKFCHPFGIRECQRHEILSLKLAQFTTATLGLAKGLMLIRAAAIGNQQRRYGMPTMGTEECGCTVISSHNQDIRRQSFDPWHHGIQLLNSPDLAVKITIFAGAVGVFEVDKERVLVVPEAG